MNIDLPEHLQATARRLSRSLPGHTQDQAPSLPEALLHDLSRVSDTTEAPASKPSLLARLRSAVSSPAFGLAATAVFVIGFLLPNEVFRGEQPPVSVSSHTATVVLITDEPETREILEASGLFDMKFVIETSDPLVAAGITTAKLLVDVKGGAIVGYNAQSREVISDELPTDPAEQAERIALAFGALH